MEHQIRNEKLQHHFNKEGTKIAALSSYKIDKFEYLTWDKILSSDQSIMIEKTSFTYSPLGKAFEKQIKTFEEESKLKS